MAGPDDKLVVRGAWGEIRYVSRPDASRPAEEFYASLSIGDKARVDSLLKRMADIGRIFNRTKFKQVDGDIFEFKIFAIRISCYRERSCWYLLHAFTKKSDRWPAGELIRAKNLLREHRGH